MTKDASIPVIASPDISEKNQSEYLSYRNLFAADVFKFSKEGEECTESPVQQVIIK
jgi:hypothetical protein